MNKTISRKGFIFILSSPSGAGKTTLCKNILETETNILSSISLTTRAPRANETHGKDYFFVSKDDFFQHVKNEELVEHAEVFGNLYGTPKSFVDNCIQNGTDVLFDIDWQGTQQVQQKYPEDVVRVFILPPSIEVLEQRLRNRATDSEQTIDKRMNEALSDISHFAEYDYVIINDDLKQTSLELSTILRAERLKRCRQKGIVDFVNQMRFK